MVDSALAEDADLDGDSEFNISDDAVAAGVLAFAAAFLSEAEFTEDDWVSPFVDFGVGDSGVGHVRVDAAGTVPRGAGAGSAGDGFVVSEASGWG